MVQVEGEMTIKKNAVSISFIFVLLLSVARVSFAQGMSTLDGVHGTLGEPGSITIYAQDGNKVSVTGYAISRQPRVWYGTGQRDGNTISYAYVITLGPSRLAGEKKPGGIP